MNHLILLLVCILSVEIFVRSNLSSILSSALKVPKRVAHVITSANISDHWKEKVIPAYALRMMKVSLQILLIILAILSLFLFADYFFDSFLAYTLSFFGIIESMIFAISYGYFKTSIIK